MTERRLDRWKARWNAFYRWLREETPTAPQQPAEKPLRLSQQYRR